MSGLRKTTQNSNYCTKMRLVNIEESQRQKQRQNSVKIVKIPVRRQMEKSENQREENII